MGAFRGIGSSELDALLPSIRDKAFKGNHKVTYGNT
jgi:hypothetical protein